VDGRSDIPGAAADGSRSVSADLLIRHAFLITMDADRRVLEDGAIVVSGRRIAVVGEDATVAPAVDPIRTIDARGGPVHPGLIESHAHASFHLFRGAVPDRVGESEVFEYLEHAYHDGVSAEEEGMGVELAAIEMIRSGTTCFLEPGTVHHPSAAADAATRVGIRAVIGDARVLDLPHGRTVQQGPPTADSPGVERFIQRSPRNLHEALGRLGGELWRNRDPDALVTGHIALLGLGTASEELLVEARRRADDAGVVLNLHHAYDVADTEADRARYGMDPLVRLGELGVLGPNVTLAHGNHLTDAECEVLLASGATLVWIPAASARWGHAGSFQGRHAELARRGLTVALGSDSGNWSNDFDLFRQADLALLAARAAHRDRTYLEATDVLTMVTLAGARAAGLADRIGSIEPGKRADLVIHTLDHPGLRPSTDLVRNLLYASRSKSIRTVVVDGRVVLDEGELVTIDEPRELERIDQVSRAMLRRIGHHNVPEDLAARSGFDG
jgi:cytosine/adenosine deaminase-related metal-dependent hydrolase